MSTYTDWKNYVLGKRIGTGECVPVIRDYLKSAVVNVDPYQILPSVVGAKDLAGHSGQYATWIANDHGNPNQLPEQGDIMVFGATPATGYTNKTNNKYGHTGICDSADAKGYNLLQQNAPTDGAPVNITRYVWKFRPCLGWYHLQAAAPAPVVIPIRLNKGKWNVRTAPNLDGAIIGNGRTPANGGDDYAAVIQDNGWAQIEFTGKVGYIAPSGFSRL